MELIAEWDIGRVWLIETQQSDQFLSPCADEEFAALIAVYDSMVSNDNRNTICDALIKQNCRYGVCMGYDCYGWDDALDWSFMATDPDLTPLNSRFVLTTWHESESLEDIVFHFLKCTSFDSFVPKNFVIVAIGDGPNEQIIKAVRQEIISQ